MPTASYDGKSLMIDGRRVFLVSGSIHYPRVPRELWASRIAAARQAGLNCIDVPVFWNVHEPRPGRFVFDGDADLRHFVDLIGQAGLYCILRPGPAVNADWEYGGLPAWLNVIHGVALRQHNGAMLEAAARYLGAVMEQVRDLQASAPATGRPQGGPIVLVQAENQWFCHNPLESDGYLREIVRFLRENGCDVPISLANNLWQQVDGTIDTWQAGHRLLADLRQLRVIQPRAPRIVSEFPTGAADAWGRQRHQGIDARTLQFQLVEMLAAGGQYNLAPFHGGTNLGFWGGHWRTATGDAFATASHDCDAPLGEAGQRGDKYLAVKRVSTFASHFGHVLANLEPADPHTAVAADAAHGALSVVHHSGDQGSAVFILKGGKDRSSSVDLVLPNGVTLHVPLGADCVAWTLLNVRIGASTLNYTNLRPWACADRRLLVLFGPAGESGVVCVNDAPLPVTVPTARKPHIEQHEDLTLVVLSSEMVDASMMHGDKLVVGASSIDAAGQPQPLAGWPAPLVIDSSGATTSVSVKRSSDAKAPALSAWKQCDLEPFVTGQSDAFTPLEGPASLESLKHGHGYGWYRLVFKSGATSRVLAPQAGDRLQLFASGRSLALLGRGPGAQDEPINLKLAGTVTVLAEHLGRLSFGAIAPDPKGLFGHLHAVRSVVLGKPQVVAGRVADPFHLGEFIPFARKGDHRSADTLAWSVRFTGKKPLILSIADLPIRALVMLDDQAVGLYEPHQCMRFVIPATGTGGKLKLVLFSTLERLAQQHRGLQVGRHLTLYQSVDEPTAKAQWSFAPWVAPKPEQFEPMKKRLAPLPRWYLASFVASSSSEPLWLEARGLSKGQIILNGRNVGRYFVATATGKAVPPQMRYFLPTPWLRPGEANELMLFDEHGKTPQHVRLVHAPSAHGG